MTGMGKRTLKSLLAQPSKLRSWCIEDKVSWLTEVRLEVRCTSSLEGVSVQLFVTAARPLYLVPRLGLCRPATYVPSFQWHFVPKRLWKLGTNRKMIELLSFCAFIPHVLK
jgi:hypothetical protein